ncbi:putative integral membrane protein [Cryptosporidium felis]|nr:putative integral membrane protein [Cryptosporidium felis]
MMGLKDGSRLKGFENDWNSERVISHIKKHISEMRLNALKIVDEAFSEISYLKAQDVGDSKELLNAKESKVSSAESRSCNSELLEFLQSTNHRFSQYKIGADNFDSNPQILEN